MRFPIPAAVLLLAATLAGCISDPVPPTDDAAVTADPITVFDDPRTASHPAYGWPTMTQPYGLDGELVNEWLRPIDPAQLPDAIRGLEPLAKPDNVTSGAGIAVFGHVAIIPGHGQDTALVNVSDPSAPTVLSKIAMENLTARDVDVIIHPDGRITAVFATNQGRNPIWDITDPTAPVLLADIKPAVDSHNVAVVPGTPIVYNANSGGGAIVPGTEGQGLTEIYDFTDPSDPKLVMDWKNGYGCHDITFFLDPANERYRAYCAGIEMTQIWDIADPLAPAVVTNVPVHHGDPDLPHTSVPVTLFSHLAMVSHDGDVLIVGDETGGGMAMACDKYIEGETQTASGPFGNLWFYDLTDEKNPVLKSWFSPDPSYIQNPPTVPPSDRIDPTDPFGTAFNAIDQPGCTAHFGRNIEDKDMLVMAFYGAGVLLVDYSDLQHPTVADQWVEPGMNVWDAWYYQGYVFTGDLTRGTDILTLK